MKRWASVATISVVSATLGALLAVKHLKQKRRKVLVSGFWDLLHSGHVGFLQYANKLGDVYVCVGNDNNFRQLRGSSPVYTQEERVYMLSQLSSVSCAWISEQDGALDMENDMDRINPDIFLTATGDNADGDSTAGAKQSLCDARGILFLTRHRNLHPHLGMTAHSASANKARIQGAFTSGVSVESSEQTLSVEAEDLHAFPWRICLAGGWLDQPWVSSIHPGCTIVVNVKPHENFKTRSGLATSTRAYGQELWNTRLGGSPPDLAPERLARLLFGVENPVDCQYVSGSQDALGLMLPGINRLDYAGEFWPQNIVSVTSEEICSWLERVLWLVALPSRPDGYDPLVTKNVTPAVVQRLAAASNQAWDAVVNQDAVGLGLALSSTMECWAEMLPETVPQGSREWVAPYKDALGCLFSGAGGGFLLVVSEEPVKDGFSVQVQTCAWQGCSR